ncbi:MAG: hypothetical protein LBK98_08415 [Peptococcaceae bacterium]|jgi:riboflavin kinase/FMN adenylyltransferase|nr:hypothetical protein [Peptococcaceae bacterium]
MEHIKNSDHSGSPRLENTCIALGHFDGVHSGHRGVIDLLLAEAKKDGLTSVLLSYDRDAGSSGPKILTSEEEKAYHLRQDGPSVLLSWPVGDGELSQGRIGLTERFLKDILVGALGAKVIVAGKNCPDIDLLRAGAGKYGYRLAERDPVLYQGAPITSARVMEALENHDIETAAALLGHPYAIRGKVVRGKQLGRTVGMPTANIDYPPLKQLPGSGIYGTLAWIDGALRPGMANIGKRPTVDTFDYITVENYLLDFSGDLYEKIMTMEIHVFVRDVRKFKDLQEVKEQVNLDIEAARSYFERKNSQ